MRILISARSDTTVLDSLAGMNRTFHQLKAFLDGAETEIEFPAKTSGSPEPYEGFLRGFRVRKGDGPIRLLSGPDEFLELSGSLGDLARYIAHFSFDLDEEGAHHHPEYEADNAGPLPGYMSLEFEYLIIQVDSEYMVQIGDEN